MRSKVITKVNSVVNALAALIYTEPQQQERWVKNNRYLYSALEEPLNLYDGDCCIAPLFVVVGLSSYENSREIKIVRPAYDLEGVEAEILEMSCIDVVNDIALLIWSKRKNGYREIEFDSGYFKPLSCDNPYKRVSHISTISHSTFAPELHIIEGAMLDLDKIPQNYVPFISIPNLWEMEYGFTKYDEKGMDFDKHNLMEIVEYKNESNVLQEGIQTLYDNCILSYDRIKIRNRLKEFYLYVDTDKYKDFMGNEDEIDIALEDFKKCLILEETSLCYQEHCK